MNSVVFSPVVGSYVTLQGREKLPPTCPPYLPAEHSNAKLVPRPFRTVQNLFGLH